MSNTCPSNSLSPRSRILSSRTFFVALAAVALLALLTTSALMAPPDPLTGAIYSTDGSCTGVDLNIYSSKDAVYIDGGPQNQNSGSGLPTGWYYIKVTEPDGTVLGTSVGSGIDNGGGADKPIGVGHVVAGKFDQCYQLSAVVKKASDNSPGYDTTTNNGGEYKVWISPDPDFGAQKTDNFKVQEDQIPPQGELKIEKFYDADASGTLTAGDTPIVGWEVRAGSQATFDTIYETKTTPATIIDLAPGCYSSQEGDATNWIHTNASIQSKVVVAGGTTTISFGNVCLGPGGGLTLGFWSNKNGQGLITGSQLCTLNGLNLKNAAGGNFDPVAGCAAPSNPQVTAGKTALKNWLLSGSATNMAYMLSVQFAAMQLNVLNGKVSGGAIVYAPGTNITPNDFVTINQLLAAANTELGTPGHENTTSGTPGDAFRAYQEALKNALDRANNNLNFVQSPAQCGVDPQTNVLTGVTFTYPSTFTVPNCP
jgi:hypothetical protein